MDEHPRPHRRRSGWQVLGITLAVVLAVAGLASVAAVVLLMVSLNSSADNK